MFMMMAVDKMHVIVATVTFLSFALPVILISAMDAKASSCLPTREKCQIKQHPNGSMVQTVPKRFHLPPAMAESLKRKMKTETPVQHVMCRFPDCDGNLCKNGWCEETLDGYKCHCSVGFHGEHCDESDECESTWRAFDGSCYIFSTSEVDHTTAMSACSEYGSHLVYIRSQEEQDFIMGYMASWKDYWIGLTSVPATWLDGSSLTYDRTDSTSFNEGGECFRIKSAGEWHDRPCSSEYRYICEKEISD